MLIAMIPDITACNDQCLDLSIIIVLVKIRSVSEQLLLVSSSSVNCRMFLI